MCEDKSMNLCIDMGRHSTDSHIEMCMDVTMDMCIDMCIDMYIDMCVEMCADMYQDICI